MSLSWEFLIISLTSSSITSMQALAIIYALHTVVTVVHFPGIQDLI